MHFLNCTSEAYYMYSISLLSHLGYKNLTALMKSTGSNEQITGTCIKFFLIDSVEFWFATMKKH